MKPLVWLVSALTVLACLVGAYLFDDQWAPDEPRSFPVVIVGMGMAVVVSALAATQRRPSDPTPLALSLAALVVVVGYFRLLSPPWLATVGAAAWYLLVPVTLFAATRLVDARLPAWWATWGVPAVVTGALLLVSGPQTAAHGSSTRAVTWVVLHNLGDGRVRAGHQANPMAFWPSSGAARALWIVWSAWVVGLVAVASLGWLSRRRAGGGRDLIGATTVGASFVMATAAVLASWPAELRTAAGWDWMLNDRWYTDLLLLAPGLALLAVGGLTFWHEIVTPRLSHSPDGRIQLGSVASPGAMDAEVTELLTDPTARVLFTTGADDDAWMDERGDPATLATDASRAATVVERFDQTVAAIEYVVALTAQPDLVDIAATSASMALEQRSRHVRAEREAAEVRESATRLLVAAEEARAELRERLMVGPDRRLIDLRRSIEQRQLTLDEVHDGLRVALDELRQIAHGEIPLSLDEHGLGEAVADLSIRTGVPIAVEQGPQEPPPEESVTFYLAIAHVADRASGPVSCILRTDDPGWTLIVESGPLDPDPRVADRVATLGGTMSTTDRALQITIPTRGPT